ncbi:hypothetical protein Q31b_31730 [Novipirellula aureliae]|uniref:Uncharacterized protein n=1 Tax=Novipirellula aureliae TaxID=2527966 RepID=A0A5C6DSX7_9BACT|nr:hypothetical protein [Novipirellula aureliae]TWU39858.1 hypothetical protein Q31b_31730 [Novipirellula aureliae]
MRSYHYTLFAAVITVFVSGCGDKKSETTSSGTDDSSITMDAPPPTTVDVHVHPTEGPHHGSLIELGNEEYHAELVHDEDSVTIYILNGPATEAVPIDAKEVTINLLHDGTPEQFKLAASADAADPSGKSSRFSLSDAELVGHIDDESAAPKLMVTINGTPYRGELAHDHDHAGHDH